MRPVTVDAADPLPVHVAQREGRPLEVLLVYLSIGVIGVRQIGQDQLVMIGELLAHAILPGHVRAPRMTPEASLKVIRPRYRPGRRIRSCRVRSADGAFDGL